MHGDSCTLEATICDDKKNVGFLGASHLTSYLSWLQFFFLKDMLGRTGNLLERRWAPGSSPGGVALNRSALPN